VVRISVEQIGRDWTPYLRLVEAGETVVITRADRAVAEIKPPPQPATTSHAPRPFGLGKGEFVVPDDFDAPLPPDVLDAFEGE
jgi:antitoxin (DNA-binding transcriptional repressor) of toxin-antitoxin stability system